MLQQFRTTGRAEVTFTTAYARRELIIASVIVVPLVALAIWIVPDSLSEVLDTDLSALRRMIGAAVIGFYALALLIIPVLVVVAIRRLRGSSPGLILSDHGVRAARQALGFRPVVPWPAIDSIELHRTARGQQVVTVIRGAVQTPLPQELAYEPEELRSLLDGARQHTISAQP